MDVEDVDRGTVGGLLRALVGLFEFDSRPLLRGTQHITTVRMLQHTPVRQLVWIPPRGWAAPESHLSELYRRIQLYANEETRLIAEADLLLSSEAMSEGFRMLEAATAWATLGARNTLDGGEVPTLAISIDFSGFPSAGLPAPQIVPMFVDAPGEDLLHVAAQLTQLGFVPCSTAEETVVRTARGEAHTISLVERLNDG